jgi:hypothetical protein
MDTGREQEAHAGVTEPVQLDLAEQRSARTSVDMRVGVPWCAAT